MYKTIYSRTAHSLMLTIILTACLPAACWAGEDPDKEAKLKPPGSSVDKVVEHPPSLSLTPAVVMVKAKAGQTFSQELTLWNNTSQELAFQMEARDVVMRDGKRVFMPAGEIEGSIARNAVFSEKNLVVRPGSPVTTRVT